RVKGRVIRRVADQSKTMWLDERGANEVGIRHVSRVPRAADVDIAPSVHPVRRLWHHRMQQSLDLIDRKRAHGEIRHVVQESRDLAIIQAERNDEIAPVSAALLESSVKLSLAVRGVQPLARDTEQCRACVAESLG